MFSMTYKAPRSRENKTMPSEKLVCILLISIFFISATASAEELLIRDGFWGGIDVGAGLLKQSFDEGNEDGTSFFLGFKGGYTINPHFLIGLELSGWLIEASDQYCYGGFCSDSSEGESIMQIFLISRYYPSQESSLFAKAGGGYVGHWNNRPGESKSKSGWGLTMGGGYDFLLNENVALSPFATFSYGKTENWDYRAITFGLGITIP
jgi:hypothetical protein